MRARAAKLGAHACLLLLAALCGLRGSLAAAQDTEEEWDAILLLEPASKAARPPRYVKHAKHRKRGGGARIKPQTWHAECTDDFALHAGHAFPPLVVHVVGQPDPYVITAQSADGKFDETAHALARDAFGGWESGPSVHPRLLELIYRATRHFNAPSIHLISGLRNDRKASRHSHGMAADIVLPGVRDADLAAFFREQGFTGVGTYPRSGFVHIDVREASYFWVDRSSPNKRNKVSQVRGSESKAVDEEALARGDQPTVNPDVLQSALERRAAKRRPKKKRRNMAAKKSRPRAPAARSSAASKTSPPPFADASSAAAAE
jgi:hypothetical protein